MCLPGQPDQHDVIIMVLGFEVLVEPRVREEVRDPEQLLWTLPLPEVVLPKADPQIPVGMDLRGQAGVYQGDMCSPSHMLSLGPHHLCMTQSAV